MACRLLQSRSDDWDGLARELAAAPSCALGQAWREAPEPAFRPAIVRVGRTAQDLIVSATLTDDDIFNPETRFNEFAFQHGDVFEIFLRPTTQDAYFEFHVGPDAQLLQLRFPSAEAFAEVARANRGPEPARRYLIAPAVVKAKVVLAPGEWRVVAAIPLAIVQENGTPGPGTQWLFSFSRYDYTHGAEKPVVSSSSPHQKLSFHRQEEWGTLEFQ
jgi:hypothetical protein